MTPPHEDARFAFQFADNRIIAGFPVEGVKVGQWVSVHQIERDTGRWLKLVTRTMFGTEAGQAFPDPLP
jgi:hypothetical protein